MTCPSSESQTVVGLGFELVSDSKAHVLIVSMHHAAFHGRKVWLPTMVLPEKSDFLLWCFKKSLTSYYGASRKVWLPTMVLGIHENDATYIAEPRDEDNFSWDKGRFQGLWASFVQPCLHIWPWKGERDLPEGRHITTKQRLGLQGPPELPLESPSWA